MAAVEEKILELRDTSFLRSQKDVCLSVLKTYPQSTLPSDIACSCLMRLELDQFSLNAARLCLCDILAITWGCAVFAAVAAQLRLEISQFSLGELMQFWLCRHGNGWQWLQFCEPPGTAVQDAAETRLKELLDKCDY